MAIYTEGKWIVIADEADIHDVETLHSLLVTDHKNIRISNVSHLHTAIFQMILYFQPTVEIVGSEELVNSFFPCRRTKVERSRPYREIHHDS